ncbi:TraB/GumN family protein [Candidatus Woesearchaeota archaeon]|nr:TraB/GumN family protein [Candidatus Woesearchaeota archaeon]
MKTLIKAADFLQAVKYKNLVLLGTSHIAKQSLNEVKRYIEKETPDIIALELDKKRLPALMSKRQSKITLKDIKKIGLKGFFFSLFGAWAEKKLGKLVGVSPGSEMKQAIKLARKRGIKVALVDQDIEVTLNRLSNSITWGEKKNFFIDLVKAFFSRKREIEFDLSTVPDKKIIRKMTNKLNERYPSVYKILIEGRNKVIAENLINLMEANNEKKILVILGAGHVEEVLNIVKSAENPHISFSFKVG